MSLRFILAVLLYPLAWGVAAGIGTAVILTVPPLAAEAVRLLPYVGAESFVIGAALAWHVAPAILAHPARPAPARIAPARLPSSWRRA